MRKSPGILCIVIGGVLLLAALGLYGYNRYEDAQAGAEAQVVVQDLEQKLEQKLEQTVSKAASTETSADSEEMLSPELPVVMLDGYDYIGVISIPAIDIKLPVMSNWSYPKLKISPCREFGSSRTDDLVIAAHNYESHFGKLGSVSVGDNVIFTDMDGVENHYIVQKTDILQPTDVDAVEHSGYDLVLYTCTYGGKTRITVFCDRIAEPAV